MFTPSRRWLAALAVATAALSIVARTHRPATRPGQDFREEECHALALDGEVARLRARFEARQELARALVEGRIASDEALDRYRPLTAVSWLMSRETPDRAKAADRATIEGLLLDVSYVLRNDPTKEEAVLARLRAEMR